MIKGLGKGLKGRKIVIVSESLWDWEKWEADELLAFIDLEEKQIRKYGVEVTHVFIQKSVDEALKDMDPSKVVIFNWCEVYQDIPKSFHLTPKELDRLGFIYTGSNSDALALTQSKMLTKEVLVRNKVTTPFYKIYNKLDDSLESLKFWKSFPAIVKPILEHSSDGITKDSVVDNTKELTSRVKYVLKTFNGGALVEEYIDGQEYLVSVWGNGSTAQALPLVKLDFSKVDDYHNRMYSFAAKWEKESFEFENIKPIYEQNLEPNIEKIVKDVAVAAFIQTGCNNYARIDVKVRDGVAYVLDVNANPDMAQLSEFVLAAGKLGYNHGETIIKLCEFALEAL